LGFSVSSCPPSAALQALSGGDETEKDPIRLAAEKYRKVWLCCWAVPVKYRNDPVNPV